MLRASYPNLQPRQDRGDHDHRHDTGILGIVMACRTYFGPWAVKVDGHRLVFWRSDDQIVAMYDVCVHRGSPLSAGFVDGNCLRCPYHNWAFDNTGRISDVPTEKEKRWPKRPVQRTYRVEYEHGKVVVYDDIWVK